MKAQSKILLAIGSFSLLAGGMAIANNQISTTMAEGEATSYVSSSDSTSTSDETSEETSASSETGEVTIEGKTLSEWKQELMAYQIMGVSVASALQLVVWWLLHYASKGDIRKALSIVGATRDTVKVITDDMSVLKDNYKIINDKYDETITLLTNTTSELDSTSKVLEEVREENAGIKEQNDKLKDILITITKNDPNLVRAGTYKKVQEVLGGVQDEKK
jgi:hypothetical protein